jgi:hypothetical protein
VPVVIVYRFEAIEIQHQNAAGMMESQSLGQGSGRQLKPATPGQQPGERIGAGYLLKDLDRPLDVGDIVEGTQHAPNEAPAVLEYGAGVAVGPFPDADLLADPLFIIDDIYSAFTQVIEQLDPGPVNGILSGYRKDRCSCAVQVDELPVPVENKYRIARYVEIAQLGAVQVTHEPIGIEYRDKYRADDSQGNRYGIHLGGKEACNI